MTGNRINYVVVGAFVLAMGAALIVAVALLTGRTGAADTYYAVYANVSGVQPGTKVLYEGFQVGQVEAIAPVREDGRLMFRLEMSVREGWPIPRDSQARIAASGLLSAVAVDIKGGESEVMLAPGATVPSGGDANLFAVMSDVAAEVGTLSQENLRPLLDTLNRHVEALGKTLEAHAPELLANLLAVSADLAQKTPRITDNVQAFSRDLNLAGQQFNKVLADGNVQKIEDVLGNLERFSAEFVTLSQELDGSRKRMDQLFLSLNDLVVDNRDSVDESLKDLRYTLQTVSRSIDSITQDLEGAGRNMNEFSRQIRQNPGLLLGGTRPGDDRPPPRR